MLTISVRLDDSRVVELFERVQGLGDVAYRQAFVGDLFDGHL